MTRSQDLMTDEQLMEAVKHGDLQKASVLYDRYQKRIFNFLARLTMDREQGQDLTQNVFLRMLKYRQSYKEGMRFQSWIYQMARNAFADHYQSHKNKFNQFVEVEKIGNKASSVQEDMEQEEKEELLHRSMARLSDEQRELLVLTRFQHMKYEEVAVIMDTTVANIKVKVHRAIAKLREHYFELENI
ncbi:MAG TPA: sigma-70 family RNA polymerase sigma factor [Cyclobacteriaceae bacterium]|nr:sigma-70 family RNA polymerase sigma factor [Cyclobacteriaceae bacterium]